MKNQEVAELLHEMSVLLEVAGRNPFIPRAYSRAARSIAGLGENIETIMQRDELADIPGVGEGIAKKIKEYLEEGSITELEELRMNIPIKVGELEAIPGVGPKTIKLVYDELGVTDLDSLEEAARQGRLEELRGLGPKSVTQIQEGINLVRSGMKRTLLADALLVAEEMLEHIKSRAEVERITVAGSIRRRKETIGDVDILVCTKDENSVMDAFVDFRDVDDMIARGPTKSSIRLKTGMQMDLRLLPTESYGAGLQYFTGSVDHNVRLRAIAQKKGMKLNEYGLFRGNTIVAGEEEDKIYESLGLQSIPPELRENTGEIEAAEAGELPILVELSDIRGDLHSHTDQSDGVNTIEEMVDAASSYGHEYYCISDHTKSLTIANGMDEEQLLKRIEEIDEMNESGRWKMRILKGAEVDILSDGSLDIADDVLSQLDVVTVSIHSRMKDSKDVMTERVCNALENKHVHILGHATGRLIGKRSEYEIDLEAVFEIAKKNKVAMELNAHPRRLDLNSGNLRAAKREGLKVAINTDAHRIEELKNMRYGVYQARRGWLTKDDLLNTISLPELTEWLK